MKLIEIDPEVIVHKKLRGLAEILKPVIFLNGTQYCCLLGPDDEIGLMATADTPLKALNAWNNALLERFAIGNKNDFIVEHIHSVILNASNPEKVQKLVNLLLEAMY